MQKYQEYEIKTSEQSCNCDCFPLLHGNMVGSPDSPTSSSREEGGSQLGGHFARGTLGFCKNVGAWSRHGGCSFSCPPLVGNLPEFVRSCLSSHYSTSGHTFRFQAGGKRERPILEKLKTKIVDFLNPKLNLSYSYKYHWVTSCQTSFWYNVFSTRTNRIPASIYLIFQ